MASKRILRLLGITVVLLKKKKLKKQRSRWVKEWLLKRNPFSHINLLNELKPEPLDWINYLRMDENTYNELLNLVSPLIIRKETRLRPSISPHERLSATLRFLATGRSYEDLKFSTIISPQALGGIIPETCRAIIKALQEYMKFPEKEQSWKDIAKEYEMKWQFPHCLGSVDGKHIRIVAPPDSGSYFYNYKGYHSIVLLAIVNANYEFIFCDVGTNGRVSDGGVIENTDFYHKLKNNSLHIPKRDKPINSEQELPYVFVGDDAFALRSDFLKPFGQHELTTAHRIYNYRLCRARRVVENAFGIMTSRFRIFNVPINVKLEKIDVIVMACCYLHNFLRRVKCANTYSPIDCFNLENIETGEIRHRERDLFEPVGLQQGMNRNPTISAKETREQFVRYFNQEGAVPWQDMFM